MVGGHGGQVTSSTNQTAAVGGGHGGYGGRADVDNLNTGLFFN